MHFRVILIRLEEIPEETAVTENIISNEAYAQTKSNKKITIIPTLNFSSEDYPADKVDLSAPQKPKFTKELLDNKEYDDDWTDIVYQVETLFGKQISSRDAETLLHI